MLEPQPRFWAFLSYSHADARWADWLHKELERFVVPRRLVGRATVAGPAPKRFRPIFRDREELSAGADLGERLCSALRDSAFLVVICSRKSASSRWVEEEVRQFKACHGEDHVMAVIVDGEPFASSRPGDEAMECFPRSLRNRVDPSGAIADRPIEPVAADLRPGRDRRRVAVLKLLAGMLGVNLDELVQREAQSRNRRLLALAGASATVAAIMAVLAAEAELQRRQAVAERAEAVGQRAQAEGLIEFMIGDLRKKLEPAGRLDALDAAGERALAYYSSQHESLDASSLGRRARVLHMIGEIRDRRGDPAGALTYFKEAAKSTGELLRQNSGDPQRIFDHAQSVYWVGYIAWRRGQDATAREAFEQYLQYAQRLSRLDPSNQNWLAEVDYANSNLGTVLLDDGRADEAAQAFGRALAISASLAKSAPSDRDRQMDLGQSYAWVADADELQGHLRDALQLRASEAAVYRRLLGQTPSDDGAVAALAFSQTAVAKILLMQGHAPEALGQLDHALTAIDRLLAASPDDASYKRTATAALLLKSQILLGQGKPGEAGPAAQRALALSEGIVRRDPTAVDWSGQRLGAARVQAIKIEAALAATAAARRAALAPAVPEAERLMALSNARPANLNLARVAAEAALLAGDSEALTGRSAKALEWWTDGAAVLTRNKVAALAKGDPVHATLGELARRMRGLTASNYDW